MAAQESPLQTVKRLYGSRDKLVSSLSQSLRNAEEEAEELATRLAKTSNKKLLRLAEVSKQMADKYGGREKLAAAVASAYGKAKDSDYVAKLANYSPARLLDMLRARGKGG